MATIMDPVHTGYTLDFGILGHYFGLFWRSRQSSWARLGSQSPVASRASEVSGDLKAMASWALSYGFGNYLTDLIYFGVQVKLKMSWTEELGLLLLSQARCLSAAWRQMRQRR